MRLADVDKILKDLENNPNLDFSMCDACWGEIYTTIDNAPTITPEKALMNKEKEYKRIYCCADCIYYKRHKCVLGASEEGTGREHFYRDCPLPTYKEDEQIERR